MNFDKLILTLSRRGFKLTRLPATFGGSACGGLKVANAGRLTAQQENARSYSRYVQKTAKTVGFGETRRSLTATGDTLETSNLQTELDFAPR